MSTQPDHHDLAAGALAEVSGFATDAEQIRGLQRHGVSAGVTYAELWASHGSHAGAMLFYLYLQTDRAVEH